MAKAERSSLINASFPPFPLEVKGVARNSWPPLKAPSAGGFLWENNASAALSSHLLSSRRCSLAQKRGSDVRGGEREVRKDTISSRTGQSAGISLWASHLNLGFKVHQGLSFPQQLRPRCEKTNVLTCCAETFIF